MEEKEIIERNGVIAEFMALVQTKENVHGHIEYYWHSPGMYVSTYNGTWCFESPPPFNKSWGWLMPVVEKICKISYDDGDTAYPRTFGMLDAETGQFMVRFNRSGVCHGDTLIEATFLAVLDFIKYSS